MPSVRRYSFRTGALNRYVETEESFGGSVDPMTAGNGCIMQLTPIPIHFTGSFEDAILAAANLDDEAETTAAVCGQVAGAQYGMRSIPQDWARKTGDAR